MTTNTAPAPRPADVAAAILGSADVLFIARREAGVVVTVSNGQARHLDLPALGLGARVAVARRLLDAPVQHFPYATSHEVARAILAA